MLFKNIDVIDENFDLQHNYYVGVKDAVITYVGPEPPADADSYGEIYDGKDRLLMPGLYNAHAHAPMTMLRGYAENLPLQSWLEDKVWPFEAKMTPEDNYWACKLACAEMARFGVVGYSDMYYASRERIQATNELGMKVNLCEGLLAFEDKPYCEYPICDLNEALFDQFHNSSDGRIKVDYNIHAEYTSNPRVCAEVARIAKEKGAIIHVHISETEKEHEECKQRHDGMTPVQYFDSLGVFDVPVTAAHCVWIEDCDIEILKNRPATVVNVPASNMKLGSGFAPVAKMVRNGINVALGTDGVASNNNHDMFLDMYLMAIIYAGFRCDPCTISTKSVLNAATRAGALAQGREDCGLVKEGFRADICVLDTSGLDWTPATNPIGNLMYADHGSDVVLTMCDGRIIYRDGVWPGVDIEEVKRKLTECTQRVINEVKLDECGCGE